MHLRVQLKNMNKKRKVVKIEKDTNLGGLVFMYPETEEILVDYGLHCAFCAANSFDTIEMGAKIHGLDDDEIEEMLERINEVLAHGE